MTSTLSRTGFFVIVTLLLTLAYPGCAPSSPSSETKTEDQIRDEKKIQELSKKGYDFKEIRAIMKGEEPPPRAKKKSGSSRR